MFDVCVREDVCMCADVGWVDDLREVVRWVAPERAFWIGLHSEGEVRKCWEVLKEVGGDEMERVMRTGESKC